MECLSRGVQILPPEWQAYHKWVGADRPEEDLETFHGLDMNLTDQEKLLAKLYGIYPDFARATTRTPEEVKHLTHEELTYGTDVPPYEVFQPLQYAKNSIRNETGGEQL